MEKTKIISWNVNGLRSVYGKGFLENLGLMEPDILCLQETRVSPEQLPAALLELPGYSSFFSAADRPGYSGVAVYSRLQPLSYTQTMGLPQFDGEGRLLALDYGDFILCNVYFPNGKASPERLRYKMDFYEAFLEYAGALADAGRNVIVCGDVNTAHKEIDLARPRENSTVSGFLPEERAWIDRLLERGFLDTFRLFDEEPGRYSWWDMRTRARERNAGWRIDYFFVSRSLRDRLLSAFILPEITGSDHCPVGIELAI